MVSARDPHQRIDRPRIAVPRWLTPLLQVAVSAGLLAALIAVVDWNRLGRPTREVCPVVGDVEAQPDRFHPSSLPDVWQDVARA